MQRANDMSSRIETAQGEALAKFFAQAVAPQSSNGRILAIRSASTAGLLAFDRERLVCLQTNRASADTLERAGMQVVTDAAGPFELCLIEATRDRDENLYHIALAWSLLSPGGSFVLSAANALGGETLTKRIKDSGLPVAAVYAKARCRVIAVTRSADSDAAPPREWLTLGELREIPGTGLLAGPGMFSAHAVDAGTRLLCEALDRPLTGRGADFGAGYGALARHVLVNSPELRALDLYEAEWKALAAAKCNLAAWQDRVELAYHWADVTVGTRHSGYDWIVMNPPFHSGQAADATLGQRFIHAAARALHERGTLWLVANRHLPYEATLKARFKRVIGLGQSAGYKVYRACHPAEIGSGSRAPRTSRPAGPREPVN